MERHVNYTLIGGIFLACMVCMVVFILWLGHFDLEDKDYMGYVMYTDKDLNGIGANTPINYKGIQIGSVRHVAFDKGHLGMVKLDLRIQSRVPIHKDSSLKVESQGLVGLKYLSLIQSDSKEFYSKNDSERVLRYEQSFLEKLTSSAGHISNEVLYIIKSIEQILSPQNIDNISKTIASIQKVTGGLDNTRLALERLLDKATQTAEQATKTLKKGDGFLESGRTLAEHGDQLVVNINKKVEDKQYDFKTMLTPLIMQMELSLRNIDNFVQKGSSLIDKFDANPYKTIFGDRK
ncbi:MlaD family protein [Helicobacter suis]|uniref:ABC transport system substrate-binding protein n=2 Tax=Helicobacter suis TaxID=104628 RepID=E7G4E4_9HELI|nr:MlaD family protein [Helicobacter suis]EFX41749.1 ABC transport system substrate-binding protein [Helicobacter suis HS5]EFX43389.1 ABC transport system substrate binding protein [Helicobacter suis HS1]BCD46443.1 ABC transport system substrate binding protein [Helicobacter suis]BCD47649.1 ABC transport system substrate binding protein [Helicobacter suis]BCD49402.1 ABC transport system substrate binding protein [Helicobacter suis]